MSRNSWTSISSVFEYNTNAWFTTTSLFLFQFVFVIEQKNFYSIYIKYSLQEDSIHLNYVTKEDMTCIFNVLFHFYILFLSKFKNSIFKKINNYFFYKIGCCQSFLQMVLMNDSISCVMVRHGTCKQTFFYILKLKSFFFIIFVWR